MKKAAYNIMPGTEEILKALSPEIQRLPWEYMPLYCMLWEIWTPISCWSQKMTCLGGSFRI